MKPALTVDRTQSPPALAFEPGFNVAVHFIDRHVPEGRGAKLAIRSAAGDVTYAELAANVNRCGNALLGLGLEKGQRLLLVVKDCAEFFYLFWGAVKAGIIPVPLNTILRAKDYQGMIEDSGCAAVAWSPEFAAEVEPALAAARPGPRVRLPVEGGAGSLRSLLAAASPELKAVPAAATGACFWLYSSGSTGKPKGTVHRHRDMAVMGLYFGQDLIGWREEDISFSAPKLFFAYGLSNGMAFPLWMGATTVLLEPRPTAQNTLATIERYRPTLYFGVPTMYALQLQALDGEAGHDLSSLRLCHSAGEPLAPDLFRRWKERTGLPILDGIGSTEVLGPFVSNREGDVRPGSSGKPVPGYEVRIVTAAGAEAGPGEPGVLQVKGLSTAAYYWNNSEKTAQTFRGEWAVTGDTFTRDEEGYYHFCGRNDDMLKVGGIWCSPIEIEARLTDHPKVLEVAVVGRPDATGNVKPEAWVVLRDGVAASDQLAEELMAHCKAHLAPYKFPRRVHFASELPKTATGKIQRFRLRDEAPAPGRGSPSASKTGSSTSGAGRP
jgi:benzoate-CoA ligase family protein